MLSVVFFGPRQIRWTKSQLKNSDLLATNVVIDCDFCDLSFAVCSGSRHLQPLNEVVYEQSEI